LATSPARIKLSSLRPQRSDDRMLLRQRRKRRIAVRALPFKAHTRLYASLASDCWRSLAGWVATGILHRVSLLSPLNRRQDMDLRPSLVATTK